MIMQCKKISYRGLSVHILVYSTCMLCYTIYSKQGLAYYMLKLTLHRPTKFVHQNTLGHISTYAIMGNKTHV